MSDEIDPKIRKAWGRLLAAVDEYNCAVRELRSYPGVDWKGPNAELEVKMCTRTTAVAVDPL